VHQLFINFKEAYDSVRREVLCNSLIEFGIPMKLARLVKMCLNEIYSRVQVGKHLTIKNGFNKQGSGEDYIKRNIIICTLHQILFL
jgi:hypothetical protein